MPIGVPVWCSGFSNICTNDLKNSEWPAATTRFPVWLLSHSQKRSKRSGFSVGKVTTLGEMRSPVSAHGNNGNTDGSEFGTGLGWTVLRFLSPSPKIERSFSQSRGTPKLLIKGRTYHVFYSFTLHTSMRYLEFRC